MGIDDRANRATIDTAAATIFGIRLAGPGSSQNMARQLLYWVKTSVQLVSYSTWLSAVQAFVLAFDSHCVHGLADDARDDQVRSIRRATLRLLFKFGV